MVDFAVEVCRIQLRAGRAFIFEHPRTATSWELEPLKLLMGEKGVFESVFDMCCFGMMSKDEQGPGLVRKTTRILTNSEEIVGATLHRCQGGHRHVALVSGRAKACAEYPENLCEAFLKGLYFWEQRQKRGPDSRCLLEFARSDLCDPEESSAIDQSGQYIDDIKGDVLSPVLARTARAEEMEVFHQRRVYDLVDKSLLPPGTRIVGTRWVETNKGTAEAPKVRSRLVCQEFNVTGDPSGELFAPTPPLGATRYLLSALASSGLHGLGSHRAMLLDFKRAFFSTVIVKEMCISRYRQRILIVSRANMLGSCGRPCMALETRQRCGKSWCVAPWWLLGSVRRRLVLASTCTTGAALASWRMWTISCAPGQRRNC